MSFKIIFISVIPEIKHYISTHVIFLLLSLLPIGSIAQKHDSITNFTDSYGLRQGIWKITWKYGNEEDLPGGTAKDTGYAIGNYLNNKKEGTWTYYFMTGNIYKKLIYKHDNPFTVICEYSYNHAELDGGTLKDGNGIFKEYSPDGGLELVMNFKDSELNGMTKAFDKKGSLCYYANYVNGKRQGECMYSEDKDVYDIRMYKNDTALGNYWITYNKGVIVDERLPINDSVARQAKYYINGFPETIKYYNHVKGVEYRCGTWKKFDKNGHLIKQTEFYGKKGSKTIIVENNRIISEDTSNDSNDNSPPPNVDHWTWVW